MSLITISADAQATVKIDASSDSDFGSHRPLYAWNIKTSSNTIGADEVYDSVILHCLGPLVEYVLPHWTWDALSCVMISK